jgi:hypothetical protein
MWAQWKQLDVTLTPGARDSHVMFLFSVNGGRYPRLHEKKGKCKRKQELNSSVTSCDEAKTRQRHD